MGIFCAQILGLPSLMGTDRLWAHLVALPILPALLLFLAQPALLESPRWYALHGNGVMAEQALLMLRPRAQEMEEVAYQRAEQRARAGAETRAAACRSTSGHGTSGHSGHGTVAHVARPPRERSDEALEEELARLLERSWPPPPALATLSSNCAASSWAGSTHASAGGGGVSSLGHHAAVGTHSIGRNRGQPPAHVSLQQLSAAQPRTSPRFLLERNGPPLTPPPGIHSVLRAAVKSPAVRRALYVTAAAVTLQEMSGVSNALNYSCFYLERMRLTSASAALITIWINLAHVLATPLAATLMESLNRRSQLMSSMALMAFSVVPLSLSLDKAPEEAWAPHLLTLSLVSFVGAHSAGVGPVCSLLHAEVFPASQCTSGAVLAASISWMCRFGLSIAFVAQASFTPTQFPHMPRPILPICHTHPSRLSSFFLCRAPTLFLPYVALRFPHMSAEFNHFFASYQPRF